MTLRALVLNLYFLELGCLWTNPMLAVHYHTNLQFGAIYSKLEYHTNLQTGAIYSSKRAGVDMSRLIGDQAVTGDITIFFFFQPLPTVLCCQQPLH